MNTVEQSKIISALKSELSNLKFEVTKLISNDKDFNSTHNSVQTQDSQQAPKQQTQTRTLDSLDYSKQHQYISTHACTVQRKPSFPNESSENRESRASEHAVTQRPAQSDPQLREDLKNSQMRERRLIEERDDLARKLQERSKELDGVKQSNDSRSDRFTTSK